LKEVEGMSKMMERENPQLLLSCSGELTQKGAEEKMLGKFSSRK
jgi:hypothetical protein